MTKEVKIKTMTIKQAITIVENHNKWRRDNNVPPKTKMGDVKKLGIALDVLLIVAKDYCKIHDMDRVEIRPKTKWKEQSNLEGKEKRL